MKSPTADNRNSARRALDEQIANEPPLLAPQLAEGAIGLPLEAYSGPGLGDTLKLVDQLLQFCSSKGVEIQWNATSCRVMPLAGRDEEVLHRQLRASLFPAILARIAALCQFGLHAISPYGGEGTIEVPCEPTSLVRVLMAKPPQCPVGQADPGWNR